MKFLADANVETALVHWLRAEGHDVKWAAELQSALPDPDLLSIARHEERVFLTYDRDFGELVFRHNLDSHGVVLLRFDAPLQKQRLTLFRKHWLAISENLPHRFLVVSDNTIRVRPLPSGIPPAGPS